jgi:multidrug efflux system membrane fusion protein
MAISEKQQTAPPGLPDDPHPSKSSSRVALAVGFVFLVLIAAGIWWAQNQHKAAPGPASGMRGRGEMPPVPVIEGTVAQKDVKIYLDGLGTVQAFNTVTIRSRVDGQLQKVAFSEGQDVRVGDLLAQIDPDTFKAQLAQAEAKKGQDEAQLANAKADLQRYADLLANEGVTQQVYDTQKALVSQLEAGIKADQASIDNVKVQLGYTTITSPIEGRVGIRQVDQGNIIHANDANGLVVITQLKPISVVFTLPGQFLNKIHNQAAVTGSAFKVLAVADDNTTVLSEGELAVIDNQIDTNSSTIKLKATFPNTDLKLWPGQFVNARLLLTICKDSAVVPASVIQRGAQYSYAFVINPDDTVDVRPVKIAQTEQGETLIEEGLHPGERVVVDGQYKLQKGSKVRPQSATKEPEAAGASSGAPTSKPNGAPTSKPRGDGKKKTS